MGDSVATWDNSELAPWNDENNLWQDNWLYLDRDKNGFDDFYRNFVSFENDYNGLVAVGNVNVESATLQDVALIMKYNSYELFMIRCLGSVALAFGCFVVLVKGLRAFKNRIKGGQL